MLLGSFAQSLYSLYTISIQSLYGLYYYYYYHPAVYPYTGVPARGTGIRSPDSVLWEIPSLSIGREVTGGRDRRIDPHLRCQRQHPGQAPPGVGDAHNPGHQEERVGTAQLSLGSEWFVK